MRVTSVLLFIPCFFNVVTSYADLLLTSPSGPVEQKPDFYMSVQRAGSRVLVKWDPRKVTSGSLVGPPPTTLLKSLIVEVEGPGIITKAEDLILITRITNTGSETLRLINEPSGVLYSHLPTRRFYVTHSSGAIPQFKGVQVEFSLTEAIKSGYVTTLGPGQFISVPHDFSKAYNFAVSGFGHYNFKPRNRFFIIDPVTKKVMIVQAGSSPCWTSVDWSPGGLVAWDTHSHEWLPDPPHTMKFRQCDTYEMCVLYRMAVKAKELADAAAKHCTPGTQCFDIWFGKWRPVYQEWKVKEIVEGICDNALHATYSCMKCTSQSAYAFTLARQ